ncbi:glycosyl transferase [Dyadobacter sediminis]|nr:glycosyl transferase [Dyadobacter sediminis]
MLNVLRIIMKIKVLHILNNPSIGGIETFVYYLTKVQQNNPQLDISLLFSRPDGNLKEMFIATGVKCFFLNIKPFDLDINKYAAFKKISLDFDILHFHTFLPIRDLLASRSGSKRIFTQHSVDGIGRVTKKTDFLKRMMLRNFLNTKVDYVTYNSHYTKQFWKERGISNEHNQVVYNGVTFAADTAPKNSAEPILPVNKNHFVIGTSSRFIPWKRVDLLIRSFALFQAGKEDVTLLLVGDGTEMDNLKKLVKELHIENKVTFTGYTTNVTHYQSLMDVCVFPSTTEAFGLVAIECLYLGKPVLVFKDGGGITELIEKIEPENVVSDVNALAGAFDNYYQNRDLLSDEHKKKRRAFAEQFNMEITAEHFFNIYKEIL